MITAFISTLPRFFFFFYLLFLFLPVSFSALHWQCHIMSTNQCSTVTNHRPSIKTDSQRATPSLSFSPAELFVSSTTKSYWLKLVMDLKWGPVGSLAAEMAVYWITGLIWFGARCVHQNVQPPQRELRSSPDFWTFSENTQVYHQTRLTLSTGCFSPPYIFLFRL